ncbi:MAG: rRNA pseudouridine synthase [Lachnospiraceae bacterium]|nr:rRNA pseudouridine synthase [Lachnospiraceae bacterium]
MIRLDKLLADCGVGTRSEVKSIIKAGRVCVDGAVVKDFSLKLKEGTAVTVDGRFLVHEEFQYFMLNKPKGVVSATEDKREKTVLELISCEKRRDLFPVGRLDKDTTGLLLITNDGALANRLLAPGKHVNKEYLAWLDRKIDDELAAALKKGFEEGLDIGDEKPTAPAEIELLSENEARVTISEGRYHQVKRMFACFDLKVTDLKRISMGKLKLDEGLAEGEFRRLKDEEIKEITKELSGFTRSEEFYYNGEYI